MNTGDFYKEFREQSIFRLEENTPRIAKCLDKLSEAEIWQRPNESSNSIGNLILHLCGNIRQYAISSLGNLPDTRQRATEFNTREGKSKSELLEQLSLTVAEAVATIRTVSEYELLRTRRVQAYDMTGIGIIIHVVEHYSYHTGQIAFFTKLLKDNDLGFYKGVKL